MVRTGIGGYDLFQIAMEESAGIYRIKIGKKVPRILRTKKAIIRKSVVGYWYKVIRPKPLFMHVLEDKNRIRYNKEDFSLDWIKEALKDLLKK